MFFLLGAGEFAIIVWLIGWAANGALVAPRDSFARVRLGATTYIRKNKRYEKLESSRCYCVPRRDDRERNYH